MSTTTSISTAAHDKKRGMTLDELAAFVQDAMRQNLHGQSEVKATVGWRSQIQKLEVAGETTHQGVGSSPRTPRRA